MPARTFADGLAVKILPRNLKPHPCLDSISKALLPLDFFEYVALQDFLPESSNWQRHNFIRKLEEGLQVPCVLLTYSTGNNHGNYHFIWKVTGDEGEIFERSQAVIDRVRAVIPKYHTRAMRKQIQEKFGRLSSGVKPHQFRFIYKELTGDSSESINLTEKEIDQRVREFIDMEDIDILPDLRIHNSGRQSSFDSFWNICEQVLNDQVGLAVDDRRHDQVTHIASVVSVRDLWERTVALCP